MFWDTIYPDHFWIWRFLSASRHLEIADEDTSSSEWEIAAHNYSRLVLACSQSLRSLHLASWLVRVPMQRIERIFQLSLFPQLEYLSFGLPLLYLPSSDIPKPLILAISNIFSGISSSHPIQCLNIRFSPYRNPTIDVPLTSEWSTLDDTLNSKNLSKIQVNLLGEDNNLARSLFYSVFTKCRRRVVFAIRIPGDTGWGWKGESGAIEY
ncbi:hypothetical protein DL96DRAFT_1585714 [Flagelloscypha sp. PMI_526]|nr:hypothetical protein DL96DRAFT_1585714 [Flagelloscypha sp. PMI_526]